MPDLHAPNSLGMAAEWAMVIAAAVPRSRPRARASSLRPYQHTGARS
jgi:hypothetical protein